MLKKIIAYLFFGTTDVTCGILFKGSGLIHSLVRTLAEHYTVVNKSNLVIRIETGGGTAGVAACLAEQADGAYILRNARPEEVALGLIAVPFAYEFLLIIVNKANPINNISLDELCAIFSGTKSQWANGELITTCINNQDERTNLLFTEIVTPNVPVEDNVSGNRSKTLADVRAITKARHNMKCHLAKDTEDLLSFIGENTNAIGVISYSVVKSVRENAKLKLLAVDHSSPLDTASAIAAYPLKRPLNFATKYSARGKTKKFLKFILSCEGQQIVAQNGLVPFNTKIDLNNPAKN